MTRSQPAVVQPDTGTDLYAFGNVLSLLLTGGQTGGTLTVLFNLTPVGGSSPMHVHSNEDVLCLVVDGRISYFVTDAWHEVAAGGLVYLPRGTVHAHRNVGLTPAHHWLLCTPAGLEPFLERSAEEFSRLGGPDEAQIRRLFRSYGLELVGDASPERTGKGDN